MLDILKYRYQAVYGQSNEKFTKYWPKIWHFLWKNACNFLVPWGAVLQWKYVEIWTIWDKKCFGLKTAPQGTTEIFWLEKKHFVQFMQQQF